MPTSDLDMPLLPSSEQIRRREFATVRRGYDPQQVRMYLTSIAEQVETLERELSQLRLETGAAIARRENRAEPAPAADATGDPYDALSKRFANLIEVADQEAARTIEDARREAAQALDDARSEADRIRVDAQARAEEARQEGADLLERARIESERALSGLADRRQALLGQLQEMRMTLLAAADELALPLEQAEHEAGTAVPAEDGDEEIHAQLEGSGERADAIADPRYEELWVAQDPVELPDLAAIDLDFDDPD